MSMKNRFYSRQIFVFFIDKHFYEYCNIITLKY